MSRETTSDCTVASGPSAASDWLVIGTRTNQEQIAVANLGRQGFEPYCPQIAKLVRHARTTTVKSRPLFPGYVFVRHHSEGAHWRPILSTLGVRTLVRFGDQPGRLDDRFIVALRLCERDGLVVAPPSRYHVGQSVEVTLPAFTGIVGKILAIDDLSRITVLIELMQRSVKLKLTADKLSSIGGVRRIEPVLPRKGGSTKTRGTGAVAAG